MNTKDKISNMMAKLRISSSENYLDWLIIESNEFYVRCYWFF